MIRWIKAHQEYMEFTCATHSKKTEHFFVPCLPADQGPALGITISKKVANAVKRNRLKRRIRAWAQQNSSSLPQDCRMNIIARSGAGELSWLQICQQLEVLIACK